jgi:hypothetical protein
MKTIKVAVAQNKILRYVAIFRIILCGTFQGDSLFAQTGARKNTQPFEFKVAHLGMSLEDFKKATFTGEIRVIVPGRFFPGSKKILTPVCTDTLRNFPGDMGENFADGVVMCDPSVDGMEGRSDPKREQLKMIGGSRANQIQYLFYRGKLYSIVISAMHPEFATILDAFENKYGSDNRRTIDVFQNGLGGRWRGTNYFWERGTQSISLNEGNGGDPLHNSFGPTTAVIEDHSLSPPEAPKAPSNI